MIFYDSKKEVTNNIKKARYIETTSKKDWNDTMEILGNEDILWTEGEKHAPYIYIYRNTTTENLRGFVSNICKSSHKDFRDNP